MEGDAVGRRLDDDAGSGRESNQPDLDPGRQLIDELVRRLLGRCEAGR